MHFSGRILRVGEETVLYRWEGQRTLLLSHVVFFLGWLCFLIREKKKTQPVCVSDHNEKRT